MQKKLLFVAASLVILLGMGVVLVWGIQQPDGPPRGPMFGMGPGGPMAADLKLVEEFDENHDGWLNTTERASARAALPDRLRAARGNPDGPNDAFRGDPRGAGGPGNPPPGDRPPGDAGRPGFGPPDFGPPGFGPPGFGPPGFGPPGGRNQNREPAERGIPLTPADVPQFAEQGLYDREVLRTLFIDFENKDDWEQELADFKSTDVEVPARVTVDGQEYSQVGIKFRGNSSYMMTPATYKRSLNLSMDLVDPDQSLYGYRTLNLLNCNGDPSFLSAPLYAHIASQFTAVPRANLVRVVINGENWGVYASVQQFNKDFLKEFYGSSKGTRWKVPGRPNADSGLRYTGEDLAAYKQRYEIKSKDEETPWLALKNLCRVLDETPTEQLPEAIEPILDVEGVLWFLANDVAVVNSDGYWTRASDYSIFLDEHGVFHIVPYDMNEAFIAGHGGPPGGGGGRDGGGRGGRDRQGPPGAEANRPRPGRQDGPPIGRDGPPPGERLPGIDGPGIAGPAPGERGPRGPGASGPNLDPLVGLDDPNKPLRSKLLAVPQYRQQYLENLRSIAYYGMEPQAMEKIVTEYKDLMEAEVKRDTKKNSTFEAFQRAVAVYHNEPTGNDPEPLRNADDRSNATERVPQVTSLLEFFAKRRQFLLTHPAIAALPGEPLPPSYRPAASLEATPTPKKPISKSARNTSVVINEFMAANKTKVIGPLGTYEDWIELHNTGDQEIDLTGFYLSDSTKDLKKWPFPAGTRLPPRGYLVLWADEQEPIGAELHLPFKLKASGETLTLFDSHPEGGIVDQIKFSQQTNDVAFGRWNDQLVPLVPTPGEANRDH